MKNLIRIGAVVVFLLACKVVAEENDQGYFLSFSQKMELIGRGEITDSKQNVYDVWLCPGYVYPTEFARDEGWIKGTEAFGEYFQAKKYRDLADRSGDCFEFAWEDCIEDGLIEGLPQAWSKYFSQASERVEKRVFGWFMAYPTAFVQAFGDNIFRIPITITGCVFGTTAGAVAVPGYYALNSGIEGTGRYLVPGTLVPLSGYTFNTLISPPLSLLGQRPDESRVDDFWVTMTPAEKVAARKLQSVPLTDEEMASYAEWIQATRNQLEPFDKQSETLKADYQVKYRELQNKLHNLTNSHQRELLQIEKNRQTTYDKLLGNPIADKEKINPFRIIDREQQFREYLTKKGLTSREIDDMIRTIDKRQYRPTAVDYRRNGVDRSIQNYQKADPAVESLKKPDQIMREF